MQICKYISPRGRYPCKERATENDYCVHHQYVLAPPPLPSLEQLNRQARPRAARTVTTTNESPGSGHMTPSKLLLDKSRTLKDQVLACLKDGKLWTARDVALVVFGEVVCTPDVAQLLGKLWKKGDLSRSKILPKEKPEVNGVGQTVYHYSINTASAGAEAATEPSETQTASTTEELHTESKEADTMEGPTPAPESDAEPEEEPEEEPEAEPEPEKSKDAMIRECYDKGMNDQEIADSVTESGHTMTTRMIRRWRQSYDLQPNFVSANKKYGPELKELARELKSQGMTWQEVHKALLDRGHNVVLSTLLKWHGGSKPMQTQTKKDQREYYIILPNYGVEGPLKADDVEYDNAETWLRLKAGDSVIAWFPDVCGFYCKQD